MTDAELMETTHIYTPTTDNAAKRQRLFDIVKAKSFISGEPITLTSGRISDYYFNTKPTMMDAEGASLIATLFLDAASSDEPNLVGGLEMGAVPLASATAAVSHLEGRACNAFFVRKQAKEHGTKSLIEGLPRGETMAGKRVLIVEDVTTTGGSAIKAAKLLQEEGAIITRVITVIDRQEGAFAAFKEAGLIFTALFGGNEFRAAAV